MAYDRYLRWIVANASRRDDESTKRGDRVLLVLFGTEVMRKMHRRKSYWFCNTDETEPEGAGAHQRMIDQSCVAAWGRCIRHGGAENTLRQLELGDTVFLYRSGHGVVASGDVKDESPTRSKTVFPEGNDEFKRAIANLKVSSRPLPFADIRDATGYNLPGRHIVCRIHNSAAIKFILRYFASANGGARRRRP